MPGSTAQAVLARLTADGSCPASTAHAVPARLTADGSSALRFAPAA